MHQIATLCLWDVAKNAKDEYRTQSLRLTQITNLNAKKNAQYERTLTDNDDGNSSNRELYTMYMDNQVLEPCSHLTDEFAPPSKFNIVSIATQMLTRRMGSDPICVCVCAIPNAMLNFDSDVDANANTDIKCEQDSSVNTPLVRVKACSVFRQMISDHRHSRIIINNDKKL